MKNIAVVGGGLVGSLASCLLAEKGFNVQLFEMRDDIRKMEHVQGRSINLALSQRGRSALGYLGLEDEIIREHGIPMRARLIHDLNGNTRAIPYGKRNQCIYSVGRRYLNETLLSKAEKKTNVQIKFNHKLVSIDLDTGELAFTPSKEMGKNEPLTYFPDVIIGADGAYSAVRKILMNKTRFDFSQTYIDHGYIELNIPPNDDNEFAMGVNYLHIWPRGSFMMIALPNQDKSYTVTLFMPFAQFDNIKTSKELLLFFRTYFPDSIQYIGEKTLIRDYFNTKPSSLISIKCNPYNYKDKLLLIGDAAHAMVPFYGQGMNCGFEDCSLLKELLEVYDNRIELVLENFSAIRNEDCKAICDLAMYNYVEMRSLVNSPSFLLRKKVDNFLNRIMPHGWIPLYSMVTFSRIPYKECLRRKKEQDKMLSTGVKFLTVIGFLILFISLYTQYNDIFNI